MDKICFYCSKPYSTKDNEHVFPEGLGGEKIMMNCVCPNCNGNFSKFENELISKSFISFMRIAEGSTAISPGKKNFMKEVRAFRIDTASQIAFELQVSNGLTETLRAQIALKDNLLHIRYQVQADFDRLLKKISNWKDENRTFTWKSPDSKILAFEFIGDGQPNSFITTPIPEVRGGYIGLELFEYDNSISELIAPRIFEDDKNRLKVRARSQSEAVTLMKSLLLLTAKAIPVVTSEVTKKPTETFVHHTHNGVMVNRALVKIAINCLIRYYPNAKRERTKLLTAIGFIMENNGVVPFASTHKKIALDTVEKTHNLYFFNHSDETRIRISLYNGAFQIVFMFPRISAIDTDGPGRLLIDHINRKNIFQDATILTTLLREE